MPKEVTFQPEVSWMLRILRLWADLFRSASQKILKIFTGYFWP